MTLPKLRAIFLVLNILFLCNFASSQWTKRVTSDSVPNSALNLKQPNLCDPNVQQHSGYFTVNNSETLFFWFFEARNNPDTAPVLLWLNGGPGCSSMNSLYFELGPCTVNSGGNSTTINPYSWNTNASVIFLDQPANAGYSYGNYISDTTTAAQDTYAFLQLFFNAFPKYSNLTFHIGGESYGGHWAPALANIIQSKNNATTQNNTKINLDSILIGNGLVDPLIQFQTFPTMACNSTYGALVDPVTCSQMKDNATTCANYIQTCYKTKDPRDCVYAKEYCLDTLLLPIENLGLNDLDIRQTCAGIGCYPQFINIVQYASSSVVTTDLGVNSTFQLCNNNINVDFIMSGDWMLPFDTYIPALLDGNIRVLVYAGDADYLCNWYGNNAWTLALKWSGSSGFNNAPLAKWNTNDGTYAGDFRTYNQLTFVKVSNASHMAPHDQPAATLDLFNKWIFKQAL
ncbi:peptidase S10, serine carboxypeptidase [Gigaspora margarita]|uniref:Carboxypeptidase n=1 Tax=Gigaspora margarita TaxID=4874 RepID=A0A8H4A7K4_GIGMA|nr:peptidase S10, serine carboxypeptidase [Gigaspora margarita]